MTAREEADGHGPRAFEVVAHPESRITFEASERVPVKVIGSNRGDRMYGPVYAGAEFRGGTGDDLMVAVSGRRNDSHAFYGGPGNDTLIGNQGRATLDGGAGDDVIFGGDGFNTHLGGWATIRSPMATARRSSTPGRGATGGGGAGRACFHVGPGNTDHRRRRCELSHRLGRRVRITDWHEDDRIVLVDWPADPAIGSRPKGPPGAARRSLRLFLQRRFAGPAVVQVVLDDDDGLATDFIAEMRRQIGLTQTKTPEITKALPFMISFPQGYGLVLRAETEQMAEERVYLHSYPYINLGLTMIGSPGGKDLFAIDHRAAPRKHGGRLVPGKPMFLRTLHGFNDSRVTPTQKWKLLENWREDAGLQARFPWLFAATADWNNG